MEDLSRFPMTIAIENTSFPNQKKITNCNEETRITVNKFNELYLNSQHEVFTEIISHFPSHSKIRLIRHKISQASQKNILK